MKLTLDGREYDLDPAAAVDISIPLKFAGPQPNAYSVVPAASAACEYGTLIGDTRRGGSCNFEQVTLIPHCNGTHTECVGHITDERISVRECLVDVFVPAVLISVEPEVQNGDSVIDAPGLKACLQHTAGKATALIVRTLPNDDSKLSREYGENNVPPYFIPEAMEYIVGCGFRHLLVDLPSIDRLFDEGKLTNHRIFWNVEQGIRAIKPTTSIHSTVTELIYVPDEVADGEYLLNLQIAPWDADAAPSRPIIFKSEPPA